MRRLALAMFATAVFVAAPAMANHNHKYRADHRGFGGSGYGSPHSSRYVGGHRRGAYFSPVYPYYPAPAYGFGYGKGPGYPYYNNYLFGFGGAH